MATNIYIRIISTRNADVSPYFSVSSSCNIPTANSGQAVEAVLAEPFGELPAILWFGEAGVACHIRAEKAQRDVAVIDEMTVFHADKSMGTSRFRCQITDVHGRAGRRFKAWNFKRGPAGRVRRDLCTDGEAHQQGDGVQIFHHAFLFSGWIFADKQLYNVHG